MTNVEAQANARSDAAVTTRQRVNALVRVGSHEPEPDPREPPGRRASGHKGHTRTPQGARTSDEVAARAVNHASPDTDRNPLERRSG